MLIQARIFSLASVAGKGHSASPEPVRTRELTTVVITAIKSMALFPYGPEPHQTVARKCTVALQQQQQNPWMRLLQMCKSTQIGSKDHSWRS